MERRGLNWTTWGFLALTVLILVMMLFSTLHRPEEIILPDTNTQQESSGTPSADTLTVIAVTPDTVQTAISTLSRPQSYRRMVTVEQFWSGGSGSYEVAVMVDGAWSRIDRTMPDGRVRHTIMGPEEVYIWYNNEKQVYIAPLGEITADQEQMIPTYEDVLKLPVESIFTADYRTVSEVNCIYVEAIQENVLTKYWVSLDTGLLVAAEKLIDEEVVYRMGSLSVDQSEGSEAEFTLPDGTVLTE